MGLFDGSFDPFTGGILGRQPSQSMSPGYGVGNLIGDYLRGLFPAPTQVEAQFPQTNQMPPALGVAPTSQQQAPPSSQPGGTQNSAQPGPPLNILAGMNPAPPPPSPEAASAFAQDRGGPAISERDMGLLPGFAGNLQAFGSNLTSGGNPIAGLINAFGGLLTGQRTDARGIAAQNMLAQYNQLVQSGVQPGKALAMVQNPALMQEYYGFKSLGEAKNAAGESIPIVTTQGRVGPVGGGDFMAGGMDKLREVTANKAQGEAQGQARAGIYNQQALLDEGIANIDALAKDPNLGLATGIPHLMGLDKFGPGAGTAARIHQISGDAALAGLNYLKGIGRLNINEFNAGKEAMGRLNQAQSKQDFLSALQDLRRVYADARTRTGVTAGIGPTPPPQGMNAAQFSQDELTAEARRRGLIK